MSKFPHQSHNWLIHKLMWDELSKLVPRHARGVMLDLGCGNRPYRELALPHIESYIGLDYPASDAGARGADVHADALSLPLASGSVDTVLCSELLEHLPRPLDAMAEVHRVLKPGGHLILTTPLFWQIHEEPRDYYRYTKYGLQYAMESNGIDVVHTAELTGYLATHVQMWCYFVRTRSPLLRLLRPITWPLAWLAQRVAWAMNPMDRTRAFSCLTIVVGRKAG